MPNFQDFYQNTLSKNKRRDIIIILVCLQVVLAFSYFGYIMVEPISITTLHILVIVAAMLFGYKGAIPVSIVFALTSIWKASVSAFQYQDIIFSPFRSGDPFSSILLIIPKILFALFASWLFSLYFKRNPKKPIIGIFFISIISTLFHALTLALFIKMLFYDVEYGVSSNILEFIIVYLLTGIVVYLNYLFFNSDTIRNTFKTIDNYKTNVKWYYQVICGGFFLFLIASIIFHFLSRLFNYHSVSIDPLSYLIYEEEGELILQFIFAFIAVAVIFFIIISWANEYYLHSAITVREKEKELEFERELNDSLKDDHEKLLTSNNKLEEAMNELKINYEIISAISTLYTIIFRIDLVSMEYEQIKGYDALTSVIGKQGVADYHFGEHFKNFVSEDFKDSFIKFLDLNTVNQRLKNNNVISLQYKSINDKWKEMSFIVKVRNDLGDVTNVLLLVNDIDKQKRLELDYYMAIEALSRDYSAVYICDLLKDTITPFSAKKGSFSYDLQHNKNIDCYKSFTTWVKFDYEHFVIHDSIPDYFNKMDRNNLMDSLKRDGMFVIRYDTITSPIGLSKFETRFIKISESKDSFKAIIAYRFIDDVIKKEQERNRELKQINEELKKQKHEADLANSAKANFLRRMSHDIRTPINGIRGITEIASHFPNDLEKQNEYRQKVLTSSDYLLALVNNILDMSKLESGEVKLVNTPFNLDDTLNQCVEVAKMYGAESCINIHTDFDDIKHVHLIGSSVHFRQVLNNIVSNAIKYNRQNGDIYLSCKEDSFEDDTAYFTITCKDTGLGMSKEFQEHLFEPFSQEDDGARTNYKGSGLGMSIAKELCELMGGSLSFESELNKGSTFVIKIPFKIDEKQNVSLVKEDNDNLNGIRILLVEDNKLNMEIAEFMLKEKGAILDKAYDGLEAIEKYEKGKYDLILMDIMMPNMDGYEATKKIREKDKDIPIIAMSANAFLDDIEKSKKMGMNDHVTKPLDINKLVKKINELIEN